MEYNLHSKKMFVYSSLSKQMKNIINFILFKDYIAGF